METKIDTKHLRAYTLSDYQPFSTILHVSPEEPFAVKEPTLALRKSNCTDSKEREKKFHFNLFQYINVTFLVEQ